MARPNWEYIRIDVLLPSNPKLDGLSPTAKWTLIELWAHCGQHLTDGYVRDAIWRKTGNKVSRDRLVTAGLAERVKGGYMMHDYLEHQRSRAEVQALRRRRSQAGKRSAEVRANAKQAAEHIVEHPVKQLVQQTRSKPATEAEAEAEADHTAAEVIHTNVEVAMMPAEKAAWEAVSAARSNGLTPPKLSLEAERRKQLDGLTQLMRDHPETVTDA